MMISEHLRIVEVKCDVVNDTFHNVLRFLDSLNICKLTGTCSFHSTFRHSTFCLYHNKLNFATVL